METKIGTLNIVAPVPLDFIYQGDAFNGAAKPVAETCSDGVCRSWLVELNGVDLGAMRYTINGWRMDAMLDQEMVDTIGSQVPQPDK